ncbi:MAG: hypothetical protein ACT4TC_26985 [Myxococcaceae bacterium]
MLVAPPDYLVFSRMLAHDLRLGWLLGAAVAGGVYYWWRRSQQQRDEGGGPLNLAS